MTGFSLNILQVGIHSFCPLNTGQNLPWNGANNSNKQKLYTCGKYRSERWYLSVVTNLLFMSNCKIKVINANFSLIILSQQQIMRHDSIQSHIGTVRKPWCTDRLNLSRQIKTTSRPPLHPPYIFQLLFQFQLLFNKTWGPVVWYQ